MSTVDPVRYSHDDMPSVGDIVIAPNGRSQLIISVINSARINCQSMVGGYYTSYQANDLRKIKGDNK